MADVTSRSQSIEIRQGNVGIGTTSPTQSLHVQNNVRINKSIYDSFNNAGISAQVLTSLGTGFAWNDELRLNGVISAEQIAFASDNNTITGVSTFVYYGIGSVGIGTPNPQYHLDILGNAQVTGTITVSGASAGFSGPGTNILNLNASNLFSGTVPSARVTGSYSGITSVGTLSALNVTGISSIGAIYLKGIVYDINASAGSIGQILVSTQSGVAWSSISAIGVATGTVGANQIAFGQGNNALLGVSTLVYYGIGSVGIGSATPSASLDVVGNIFSTGAIQANGSGGGFFGPGTNITNLDASQLSKNNVPFARVVGSYSGITSVGTLSALNVTGISSVGAIYHKGIVYDNNSSAGAFGQLFSSNISNVLWQSVYALGFVTGTVGANQIVFGQGNNAILGVSTLVYYGIGSVGIGSATPSASLDLIKNIKSTGAIILTGDSNIYRSSANVLKTDGSLIVESGITISSLTEASIPYVGSANALTQDATNLTWDSTFKILMIGNVAKKLFDANVILQSSANLLAEDYFSFNKNGSAGLLIGYNNLASGAEFAALKQVTTDPIYFMSNDTFVSMTIDSAQNVGIGTTSPTRSLHVHNAMRLTGGFRDSANTVGFSGRILSSTGSATLWIARTSANIRTIIPTGITTDQIAFSIGVSTIIGVSTFVFTQSLGIGSVGIGTATPTQFLHVNGAARLSGQLYDINNSPGAGGTGGVGGGLVLAPSVTGSGIAWTSTNVFTAVSNFIISNQTLATGVCATTLTVTLPNAGTYKFEYFILGISTFISCGYKFGVNFTGTTDTNGFAANLTYPSTGTTASTGVATGNIANLTGSIYESMATTTQSTTSPNLGPFSGVNDTKVPILYRIFGSLIATSGGDLELWFAPEQNLQYVGIYPGSNVVVTRY